LWPETVVAIKRAMALRSPPVSPSLANTVFVTRLGYCWAAERGSSSLQKEFDKTIRRAGIECRGRGFYCLRKTFRTVADEVLDQPATMLVMGHIAPSSDISSVYREKISDHRLRIVSDYVRGWLYPSDKDNYLEAHKCKAKEILKLWESRERLTATDVFQALRNLEITQAELARRLGLCAGYIQDIVRDRSPVSSDTDTRLRAFVQDLADGIDPKPLVKEQLEPQFKTPSDVPLPDEVRAALSQHPLSHENYRVFIDYLMSIGIRQKKLSEWWGYNLNRIYEFSCGTYGHIPHRGADRLRALFELPTLLQMYKPAPVRMQYGGTKRKPGTIPLTPEFREWIMAEAMTKNQFREIIDHLKREYGLSRRTIATWMLISSSYIGQLYCNESIRITKYIQPRFVAVFDFAQTGGAE
jgi:transcriptional regulator with XRE-family HTH domain